MKNACKHLALCTLTLILCLALAACGSDNSAIELTLEELSRVTGGEWVDVCKPAQG